MVLGWPSGVHVRIRLTGIGSAPWQPHSLKFCQNPDPRQQQQPHQRSSHHHLSSLSPPFLHHHLLPLRETEHYRRLDSPSLFTLLVAPCIRPAPYPVVRPHFQSLVAIRQRWCPSSQLVFCEHHLDKHYKHRSKTNTSCTTTCFLNLFSLLFLLTQHNPTHTHHDNNPTSLALARCIAHGIGFTTSISISTLIAVCQH